MSTDPPADPQGEPTPPAEPTAPPPAPVDKTDWKAEAKKWEGRAKENSSAAARLQALEDANKSELQKLQEQLDAVKATAAESSGALQRLQVALDQAPPGMSMEDVRWVAGRAQGATPEELAADVAELFTRLTPATSTPQANGLRTPVEQLRSGALPATPQPTLVDQIAQAEQAGDWKAALALKSQHVQQLRADQPQ